MYPHKRNIRIERCWRGIFDNRIEEKVYNYPIEKKRSIVWGKSLERRYCSKNGKAKNKPKVKEIMALYYYLLKVFPKKNLQYKLFQKMRAEVRKMEMYSKKIRFLCKYKLETINNVEKLKTKKLREKQDILNASIIKEVKQIMKQIKMRLQSK